MGAAEPIPDLLTRLAPLVSDLGPVVLRQWRLDDAASLVAAWSDPEITRWNPAPPDPSEMFARRWIGQTRRQTTRSPSIDVVLSPAGAPGPGVAETREPVIGELGFQIDRARAIGELGFWVASDFRGRGFGTRLLRCAELLAPELGIDRAVAITAAENAGAVRLLQSAAGWREVATKNSGRRAFECPVASPSAT